MKSDEQIKEDWMHLENENIEKACEYLRGYEDDIERYIAEIVASLCNVDVERMMNESSTYLSQARWLYWYAIRYMTNDTYERIAERTKQKSGISFTPNGIGQSINKMSSMITNSPMWTKRWIILKRIIKLRDMANNKSAKDDTVMIKVVAPEGVNVELLKKD